MVQTFAGRNCTDTTDRLWKLQAWYKRLTFRNNGGSTIINYKVKFVNGQQIKSNLQHTAPWNLNGNTLKITLVEIININNLRCSGKIGTFIVKF